MQVTQLEDPDYYIFQVLANKAEYLITGFREYTVKNIDTNKTRQVAALEEALELIQNEEI